MNWGSLKQHAADRTLPAAFPWSSFHEVLEGRRHPGCRLGAEKPVGFRTTKISNVRLTQSRSRTEQGIEHDLQVEGRAADDLEHVGGSGLLL
jgi:hypothetical protein